MGGQVPPCPPCLSQVRRRIPVPASLHSTTPTMIIFGLPTRQPTACLSWKLDTQYVRSSVHSPTSTSLGLKSPS